MFHCLMQIVLAAIAKEEKNYEGGIHFSSYQLRTLFPTITFTGYLLLFLEMNVFAHNGTETCLCAMASFQPLCYFTLLLNENPRHNIYLRLVSNVIR